MADDEPYDLLPHHEIEELKRQVQELKSSRDNSNSQAVVNALDQMARALDSMLKLFNEAAQDVKSEGREESKLAGKLDELIDQNKTIAQGMVSVYDMVNEFISRQRQGPQPPNFQQQRMQMPDPDFGMPFDEPRPMAPQPRPMPNPGMKGPVPMPSMPFSDFGMGKPEKKKGIFGRLKG